MIVEEEKREIFFLFAFRAKRRKRREIKASQIDMNLNRLKRFVFLKDYSDGFDPLFFTPSTREKKKY